MRPNLWRTIALVLIAAAIAFAAYQPLLPQADSFGLTLTASRTNPRDLLVTHVDAGSQAARAGIRPGDRLDIGDTVGQRAAETAGLPGTRVPLVVNGVRRVVLTARRQPPVGDWTVSVVRLAFLVVAGLLAWRRPEDPASRWLVGFLWCYGLAIGLANGLLPWPRLTLTMRVLDGMLFVFGTAAAAGFAANFPTPTTRPIDRLLYRSAFVVALAITAAMAAGELIEQLAGAISLLNEIIVGGFAVLAGLATATFVSTYMHSAPGERQRRRWVFFFVGLALFGLVGDALTTALSGGVVPWLDQAALVPECLLPVGLAYVILRHRVIDVGFVLNRAVVYAGVSLIVVGTFVVVEYLLGKYVESSSHVTSVAVQLSVALVLGFSIRFVHARVDRAVDSLLFRERHEAEAAIRTLAHDAAYITDADVLLSRCVNAVERYAGSLGAGVWLADGDMYRPARATFPDAPPIGENDPAAVAMRARRVTVHLREADSALPGSRAFPMIVRGELLGILVCGNKADDETYAPDEEDALASLAAGVGHAVDAIEIRELRKRLEALNATAGGQPAF